MYTYKHFFLKKEERTTSTFKTTKLPTYSKKDVSETQNHSNVNAHTHTTINIKDE